LTALASDHHARRWPRPAMPRGCVPGDAGPNCFRRFKSQGELGMYERWHNRVQGARDEEAPDGADEAAFKPAWEEQRQNRELQARTTTPGHKAESPIFFAALSLQATKSSSDEIARGPSENLTVQGRQETSALPEDWERKEAPVMTVPHEHPSSKVHCARCERALAGRRQPPRRPASPRAPRHAMRGIRARRPRLRQAPRPRALEAGHAHARIASACACRRSSRRARLCSETLWVLTNASELDEMTVDF
jgi:hypothetical protein